MRLNGHMEKWPHKIWTNLTPQEAFKVYKKAHTPMSLLSLTWIII
jgi:hypothetical protein